MPKRPAVQSGLVAGGAGVDVERLSAWAADALPELAPPLTATLIAGGKSNLTYRVGDADGQSVALRRPPLHSVLPTAHDMGREHRIISALGPTDVPVPRALAMCDDPSVLGAPFYVMAFVEGRVVAEEEDAGPLDDATRHRSGLAVAETLATLHAVDVDAAGLGDLARRDDYAGRQLRRWREQFGKVKTREIPAVEQAHDLLAARVPEQGGVALVHGDYRLGNCIIDRHGEVLAVLDWELSTLGDPLADIGYLAMSWPQDEREHLALPGPSRLPGFASRDELVGTYAERAGRDSSHIDFYVALAYWRVACIVEGVYHRAVSGALGDKELDVDQLRSRPLVLADLALEWAQRVAAAR